MNDNNKKQTSKSSKALDIENPNLLHMGKLEPIPVTQQEQISKAEKARLRHNDFFAVPAGLSAGMGQSGAVSLAKNQEPPHPSESHRIKPAPLHEKSEEVDPTGSVDFYKEMNGLDFPITQETGIVTFNRFERFNAQEHTYKATAFKQDDFEIQLRTSPAQFINGKTSYIKFRLRHQNGLGDIDFGTGSAANIFKRITVKLPDNRMVDLHDHCNVYNHVIDRWVKGPEYLHGGVGLLKGYDPTNTLTLEDDDTFIIMLSDLIPLLNVDTLMPSEITNNLTLTFQLEEPDVAFRFNGFAILSDTVTYDISDISFNLDSYYLDSDFLKIMHSKPFTIEYPTYETIKSIVSGHSINVELDISKSRILNVFARAIDITIPDSIFGDNMGSDKALTDEYTSVDWQVGNISYPKFVLNNPSEVYIHNLKAFGVLDEDDSMMDYNAFVNTDHIHTLDLKRSKYNLEGTPIDHTNIIRYNLQRTDDVAMAVRFMVVYMKRINIYPAGMKADTNYEFSKYEIFE